MLRRIIGLSMGIVMIFVLRSSVLGAPNPSGTGQPNAECGAENALLNPPGFDSGGFANAEIHYAGSDGTASQTHAKSSHAVSQYDVACYQQTANH